MTMLIRNYGLFWDREQVEWGAGGRRGHLKGYFQPAKWTGETDFREQRGVYVLYDSNFKIVYIGQAGGGNAYLFDRLKEHRQNRLAERWVRFSWFGTRDLIEESAGKWVLAPDKEFSPPLQTVLNQMEAVLIAAAEPPLNLQSGRFGSECYLYSQVKKTGPLQFEE